MSRYDRLLQLSTFSEEKLRLLHDKKVLLFGVGGVGQHIATYLVTNGVINLVIVDYDKAELSNLNRQILLTEKDVGKPKVSVVKSALLNKNSDAHIRTDESRIDANNISYFHPEEYDIIVDAVDNWETKLVIAKFAKEGGIPLLHVGVDGTGGQFCLFKDKSLLDIVSDSVKEEKRDGVMGPMVGVLSSLASLHLLRYFAKEEVELDTLFSFDQNGNSLTKIKL